MQQFKPYVWVDTVGDPKPNPPINPPILYIKVNTGTYTDFSLLGTHTDSANNRFTVKYQLTGTGGTNPIVEHQYPLVVTAGGYQTGMKVTVKIFLPVADGGTLEGLMTVKPTPATNYTDLAPVNSTYRPYSWMQYINASKSVLNVNVELPANKAFVENQQNFLIPTGTIDDSTSHTRTVSFNLDSASSPLHTVDVKYLLDVNSGYDPVYADIVFIIKDNPGGGPFVEEDKTVSTESEADASGLGNN